MKLITEASAEKLRGGFYTPLPIAEFILKWAVNGNKSADILEPSCGDGVFLEGIKDLGLPFASLTAIELDEIEAKKAELVAPEGTKIIIDDFHNYCTTVKKKFDVIVGNPPYIRFQYFNPDQQNTAIEIFNKADLKYTKLSNAWVSFLVGSSLLLKEKGKIGFVIPAEVLQVSYAEQLRNYIAHFYNNITIISFEKLVFPGIQQEVVLLLCEKNAGLEHKIDHIEIKDASELAELDLEQLRKPKKNIDFKSKKWTYYFLDQKEIDFLNEIDRYNIPRFGDIADVEVGITTGSNSFFTVPQSVINEYQLEDYSRPMVGRSVQVSSIIFTNEDWLQNKLSEAKAHLLVFPSRKDLNPKNGAVKYIAEGEEQGIHKGYKCGIRDDWFVVPSLKISDALFIRRSHLYPKLVVNQANAYTTDTMHRVYLKKGFDLNTLCSSYYNSLSLAFTEISGRSHGGGVLELMPNEVENILLPYKDSNKELLEFIDVNMRNKTSIDVILKHTNKIILQGWGLSVNDIKIADNIWKKLSARRLNRK